MIIRDIVEEIKNSAIELNNDDEVFEFIDPEKDNEMIINTLKDEAYENGMNDGTKIGIEQGISTGKNEEKMNIAKEMLKENIPLNMIIKITGLSEEEIDKLK